MSEWQFFLFAQVCSSVAQNGDLNHYIASKAYEINLRQVLFSYFAKYADDVADLQFEDYFRIIYENLYIFKIY